MRAVSTKDLVAASYTATELDGATVLAIADKLSRSELKNYVKALKLAEKMHTIIVDTPYEPTEALKRKLSHAFNEKNIQYHADASLLLGTRITDNDIVYESNLKNTLGEVVSQIESDYE